MATPYPAINVQPPALVLIGPTVATVSAPLAVTRLTTVVTSV